MTNGGGKSIRKLTTLSIVIFFTRFILNNKFLKWEALHKIIRVDPSICLLCRCSEENASHLFLHCNFPQKLWVEVEDILGIQTFGNVNP